MSHDNFLNKLILLQKKSKTTQKLLKQYLGKTSPDERLEHKASYAIAEPDAAAESYRDALESLGYGDEEVKQLQQIFAEGDSEKIKEAIKRIGIY
ncbi:unnamed protein product [marine sediment metagenome]|uniref:Uncharacterized protein n=1 Tax=marine sediment metagenome TaxID=412755 RepID=X1AFZ5_9ZZZZ